MVEPSNFAAFQLSIEVFDRMQKLNEFHSKLLKGLKKLELSKILRNKRINL